MSRGLGQAALVRSAQNMMARANQKPETRVDARVRASVAELQAHAPHARPFEPCPVPVLGAVCPFLEPFRGHLSPKVIKIFQN
jgi:hypothetical protein